MTGGMQDAYVIKQEFAKDSWEVSAAAPTMDRKRIRRQSKAILITKTHIGEWIRYELAVEKAGLYKAMLGAANSSGKVQKVLLRDSKNDTLCTFTVAPDASLRQAVESSR